MSLNGHDPKANRAERRRTAAERKSMARDNLRHAAQATVVLGRYGQSVGIEDQEQASDFLFAVCAMVIGTVAHTSKKTPSVVLEEFCEYVKRLDSEDPTVIDH